MDSYTYRFSTQKSPGEIFQLLLDIDQWWSGLYEESIMGKSQNLGDEFSFSAGGGMHVTKQKLVELIPNKKIVWQVIDSKLTFLDNPFEWENSKLSFDITEQKNETHVLFTHVGLEPQIECYTNCSTAWSQYFSKLEEKLKSQVM